MSILCINAIVYFNDLLHILSNNKRVQYFGFRKCAFYFTEVNVIDGHRATSEDVLFESMITLSFTSKLYLFYISFFTPYY